MGSFTTLNKFIGGVCVKADTYPTEVEAQARVAELLQVGGEYADAYYVDDEAISSGNARGIPTLDSVKHFICDKINKTVSLEVAAFDADTRVEEIDEYVRPKRDRLLNRSDNRVRADMWEDSTAQKKSEWKAYRKALRDMPDTVADPKTPVWPTPPA
mgnify:FL=1